MEDSVATETLGGEALILVVSQPLTGWLQWTERLEGPLQGAARFCQWRRVQLEVLRSSQDEPDCCFI